jgi:hypothetical protein
MISPFFFSLSLIFHDVTRFARAMVCINVWSFIGLSRYRVVRVGASNPVSHMAHTNTSCNLCSGSLKLYSMSCPCSVHPSRKYWSMDFVSDALFDGRRIRALTVVDNFTRESFAIEVGQGITGEPVVAVMNRIAAMRGAPKSVRVDDGTPIRQHFSRRWVHSRTSSLKHSRGIANSMGGVRPGHVRECARGGADRVLAPGGFEAISRQAPHRACEA